MQTRTIAMIEMVLQQQNIVSGKANDAADGKPFHQ